MSKQGPWDPVDLRTRKPRISARRWLIWVVLVTAMVTGLWSLSRAFPGSVSSTEDWMWLLRGVVLITFLSAAILTPQRIMWAQGARHAAIWVGIVGVLIIGVTYRPELLGIVQRVRMTLSPSYPVATRPHELVVSQDGGGSFLVMGKVNNQLVRFVVDTGASETVLSPADAKRIGIDLGTLRFDQPSETANGIGYSAIFVADKLAVGSIAFDDMPIMINQAPMSNSLLGMTFLRRLESFQVKGDRLYLRSHP